MRRALAAGAAGAVPALANLVVENLGSTTNAFGQILRCRLIAPGGDPAVPATVIVKLATSDRRAFTFARRFSLHRREYEFYRQELARAMLGRTQAAIEDLDAAEFLPADGGFPRLDTALSMLSFGGYRLYGAARRARRTADG